MISSLFVLAAVFFGLKFDPAATNAVTESRIYPVAPAAYRMVQPDGTARIFNLTDAEKGILAGPKPWLGVIKDRRIDIWADPEYTGGKLRTAFTFVAGRLRLMILDGKRYTFAKASPQDDTLERLFPKRKVRNYERNSTADIWRNDRSRLRLWFANPNSAGMLMAEALIFCTWLLMKTRGFSRAVVGILSVACSYGLLATGSRGALLGVILGLAVIVGVHIKKMFSVKAFAILLLGFIVAGTGIVVSGNAKRLTDTFTSIDGGNARRLKIGLAAVKMFADAPTGWRGGEVSGRNACLNWYVFDEPNSLRTHLMSLAECGWFKGYIYVFLWMMVLVSGFILARKKHPLTGAIWVAFGVAGCFNPVYRDWETWVLPVMALWAMASPGGRFTPKQWRSSVLAAAFLSVLTVFGLVAAGKLLERPTKISVRCKGKATLVNGEEPQVWVVGDPLVMGGGGFPGREILAYCMRNPNVGAIAYVYDVNDLPTAAKSVIVAGRNVPDYLAAYEKGRACKASRLLFLSASVGPDTVPKRLIEESELLWVAGSLLADRNKSYAGKRAWVKLAPGCERYIPNWTDFLSQ